MDCLSKDQLLLLQQHLTYEVYEQFMSMFEKDEELIPEDEEEAYRYILDVFKKHDHFGQISGWGNEAIFINIPADLKSHVLFYDIFENSSIKTQKDLIDYLNSCTRIPIALKFGCMRVKDSI